MISQAGVYSLKLYENKDFTFLYDSAGLIVLSSISNSGDILELTTNDNFIKYANSLPPAENNTVLNDHSISIQINGLVQSNLDLIEKLQSSIYGWIPVFEFMDNQISLINVPFFPKTDKFNSQVTHTWFEELKPRIFTIKRLQSITSVEPQEEVKGLLYFDGFDDQVIFSPSEILDLNAVFTFKSYFEIGSPVENYMQFVPANPSAQAIYVKITVNSSVILYIDNPLNAGLGNAYTYDISDYASLISEIIITKNGLDSLASVSINGDVLTPTLVAAGLTGYQAGGKIGRNKNPLNNFGSAVLFWDINNNNINAYDGQPDGNLNSAWEDKITLILPIVSGFVFGSPTTRDIP